MHIFGLTLEIHGFIFDKLHTMLMEVYDKLGMYAVQ